MFAQYMHAYHERGARATSLALLEAATMEARRAVTLNPLDAKASKLFITCSQDAVAYEPKVVDNHLLLGGAYLLKGDFRRCDQEYAFCEEIDKEDPRLAMARTIAHLISSNPSRSSKSTLTQAIKKVKELIDDDDENNQLWTLLGRLEKENSNDKEASAAFAKAKEIFWAPYRDNNKDD
jgi:cytochrome c-type biogenesis protein CcmH/NrfG